MQRRQQFRQIPSLLRSLRRTRKSRPTELPPSTLKLRSCLKCHRVRLGTLPLRSQCSQCSQMLYIPRADMLQRKTAQQQLPRRLPLEQTLPPTHTRVARCVRKCCSGGVVRVAHGDHTRPRLRKLGELHAPPLTCHPQRPSYKIHVHNKWRRPPRWLARQAQQASLWRLLSLQLAQSQAPASQQGWRRFHSWWWRPPDHPRR